MQASNIAINNSPSTYPSNDVPLNKKRKEKELEEEKVDSQQTKMEVPPSRPEKKVRVSQENLPPNASEVTSVFQEKVETQTPLKDAIIEIQVPVEGEQPKTYQIPREWMINFSTVYGEIFSSASQWKDTDIQQKMEWKRNNEECIHPQAGEIIIQFIGQYYKAVDHSLPKGLLNEANWPILLDIFYIADSFGMIPLQEACKQLIDQAIKEDLENASRLFPFILSLPEAKKESLWIGVARTWVESVANKAKALDLIYSLSEADLSSLDKNQQKRVSIILNTVFNKVFSSRQRTGWQDMEEISVACKLIFSFASFSYSPQLYNIIKKINGPLPKEISFLKIFYELELGRNVDISLLANELSKDISIRNLISARKEINQRNYREAFKLTNRRLKTKYYLFALYLKAEIYLRSSNFKEAISIYDQMLVSYPHHSIALAKRGGCYRMLGNRELAMRDLNKALQIDSFNIVALSYRAICLNEQGQQDVAIQDCDKILKVDPLNLFAIIAKGKCYKRKKNYSEAIKFFNQALAIDQKSIPALIERSKCYRKMNNFLSANSDISSAFNINPNDISVLVELGKMHMRYQNFEKVMECCNTVIGRSPSHHSALALRGNLYRQLGSYHLAIKDFNEALKAKRSARILIWRGECQIQQGNPHLAFRDFAESYKIQPNPFASVCIGICCAQLNKLDTAIKYIPDDTIISLALVYKAYYFSLQGDKASTEKYVKMLRTLPSPPLSSSSLYHSPLWDGILYRLFNKPQDAINYFNQVLTQNPNHILALSERGQCYLNAGNLQLALQDFGKILRIDPSNVSALIYSSICYKQQGSPQQANNYLQKAKLLDPSHPLFLKFSL